MIEFDLLQVNVLEENDKYGKYEIGPIARGFGYTLVNPLRRVLLSSIEGAAVTRVKIAGAKHEFATLKGMREDVLNLILNLKDLKIKSHSSEPQIIRLSAKGQGEVKAGDLELTSEVEIIDPEHVLANLADEKSTLNMELTVEKGVGYKPADDSVRSKIGVLPIDASFSPVERVKFEVAETRVGRRTDFDKVILEIFTDGTATPSASLTSAAEMLVKMYASLAGESDVVKRILEKPTVEVIEEEEPEEAVPEIRTEELGLAARALNSLKNAGIEYAGQLIQLSHKEVLAFEGLGEKSVENIERALAKQGLGLRLESE